MSRYIKLDDMRAIFCQSNSLTQAWSGFDRLPTIDIVRCKECKHYFYDELNDCKMCYIHEYGEIWEDNDFCSYGEREGE